MSSQVANSGFYADFHGMASLRARAQHDPQGVLREVAGQFEALFMEQLLKNMRAGSLGEGLFDSDQTRTYQEMWDKQLAKDLSTKGGGLGLADLLVQQLGGQPSAPHSSSQRLAVRQALQARGDTAAATTTDAAAGAAPAAGDGDWNPESPEAFIRELWPRARGAAAELGVDPKVLVAQAALETGWGQAVSRRPDGSSSFNLFNIKADGRWGGDRVTIPTLEYRDGVAVRERAAFRAYDSIEQSFDDYVGFLRGNPRYADALAHADDPRAFIQGLQDAGYATDPNYAKKIGSIIAREEMQQTVAALHLGDTAPIT
ncbi:flagellar assembly peptidoglycan hydrolase FlgJ [Endothiovibrio diazotrophicus]